LFFLPFKRPLIGSPRRAQVRQNAGADSSKPLSHRYFGALPRKKSPVFRY
jgi:hypothetical protein